MNQFCKNMRVEEILKLFTKIVIVVIFILFVTLFQIYNE